MAEKPKWTRSHQSLPNEKFSIQGSLRAGALSSKWRVNKSKMEIEKEKLLCAKEACLAERLNSIERK